MTGRKETGETETGGKAAGAKAIVASRVKATGAQDSQETVGKGDMLMGEREMDNLLPGDTNAGQNTTEGILRKSYSEVATEVVRGRTRVIMGASIVRKTDTALNKVDDLVGCFPGANIEAITERVEQILGPGKEGSNNAEWDGTAAMVTK